MQWNPLDPCTAHYGSCCRSALPQVKLEEADSFDLSRSDCGRQELDPHCHGCLTGDLCQPRLSRRAPSPQRWGSVLSARTCGVDGITEGVGVVGTKSSMQFNSFGEQFEQQTARDFLNPVSARSHE